jgi:small subunit ribosomal protein S6e
MSFKINLGTKEGKTYKLEAEATSLIGKNLNDKVKGNEISSDLEGYEFEIAGASDKSGFTSLKGVQGIALKKVLLNYGKGMHKRPRREGKKKVSNFTPGGLRLRKTVRGEVLSEDTSQVNLKLIKEGPKKLSEIFAEQNQPKEKTKK